MPLVAVPTTTGTGSESTTIAVLDVLAAKVKTGISHARLRPVLAVVDPLLTAHAAAAGDRRVGSRRALPRAGELHGAAVHVLPRQAAARAGAVLRRQPGVRPVGRARPRPARPLACARGRRRLRPRGPADLALAATFAGMGFGNAGVHVPHANAYPIAGRVRDYRPEGYPDAEPLVPHGIAVALTAPEAFRFTFPADPGRHLRAAELLAPPDGGGAPGRRPPSGSRRCCAP